MSDSEYGVLSRVPVVATEAAMMKGIRRRRYHTAKRLQEDGALPRVLVAASNVAMMKGTEERVLPHVLAATDVVIMMMSRARLSTPSARLPTLTGPCDTSLRLFPKVILENNEVNEIS